MFSQGRHRLVFLSFLDAISQAVPLTSHPCIWPPPIAVVTGQALQFQRYHELKAVTFGEECKRFWCEHCGFKAKCFTCFFMVKDIFKGAKETPLAWGLCFHKGHVQAVDQGYHSSSRLKVLHLTPTSFFCQSWGGSPEGCGVKRVGHF